MQYILDSEIKIITKLHFSDSGLASMKYLTIILPWDWGWGVGGWLISDLGIPSPVTIWTLENVGGWEGLGYSPQPPSDTNVIL